MWNMVKIFGIAIVTILTISCGNDFPSAPEYKACKYIDANGIEQEASIYDFSEEDCEAVDGEIIY